jgi:hypothetical protein
LPPDEIIVEYRSRPDFWIFVNAGDLIAPRIATVFLPLEQSRVVFRETAVVNRTVFLGERGFAVNPGIQPGIIAAAAGRPLRAFDGSVLFGFFGSLLLRASLNIGVNSQRESRGSYRCESLRSRRCTNASRPSCMAGLSGLFLG